MSLKTYEVTWKVTVTAHGHKSAARLARERMINPENTRARLEVQRALANGFRPGPLHVVYVEDPDRSDE